MNIKDKLPNEIEALKNYYSNTLNSKLTIIGLNDDRGFNAQKNILMYLKEALESEDYSIDLIDVFSMFFNKTRHIDYFLKQNVSLEEIKLIQEYGTEIELKHALNTSFSTLRGCSKIINKVLTTKSSKEIDNPDLKLSDIISLANNPMVVYASGINDIMYSLHINPFNLKEAYRNRDKDPKYGYAAARVSKQTVTDIVDGHKRNFENILGLNNNSDIYALSAYLYTDMNKDYEKIFKEVILMYNDELEQLCKSYNVSYVNSRVLEESKYKNPVSNYISKYPPYIISCEIVKEMYKKMQSKNYEKKLIIGPPIIEGNGLSGVVSEIINDIYRNVLLEDITEGYGREVIQEKIEEHHREVFALEGAEKAKQIKYKKDL